MPPSTSKPKKLKLKLSDFMSTPFTAATSTATATAPFAPPIQGKSFKQALLTFPTTAVVTPAVATTAFPQTEEAATKKVAVATQTPHPSPPNMSHSTSDALLTFPTPAVATTAFPHLSPPQTATKKVALPMHTPHPSPPNMSHSTSDALLTFPTATAFPHLSPPPQAEEAATKKVAVATLHPSPPNEVVTSPAKIALTPPKFPIVLLPTRVQTTTPAKIALTPPRFPIVLLPTHLQTTTPKRTATTSTATAFPHLSPPPQAEEAATKKVALPTHTPHPSPPNEVVTSPATPAPKRTATTSPPPKHQASQSFGCLNPLRLAAIGNANEEGKEMLINLDENEDREERSTLDEKIIGLRLQKSILEDLLKNGKNEIDGLEEAIKNAKTKNLPC